MTRARVQALCAWAAQLSRAHSSQAAAGSELIIGGYTPITKKLWSERRILQGVPPTSNPVMVSRPSTVTSVEYNFTKDRELLEMYTNPWKSVRIGRLLEDLDSMAGNVAYRHCFLGKQPPLLVTASVDEIHLRKPLSLSSDLIMKGQVVFTSASAIDIRMQLFQGTSTDPSLEALFCFVQLDPTTRKATPTVQLAPSGPEEERVFEQRRRMAEHRRAARKAATTAAAASGTIVPPAARDWMSPLLAASRKALEMPALAASDAVMMPSTCLSNAFVAQPQQRNMHGRIFGGFLMRRAFELAFATAYVFAGGRPVFERVSDIAFLRPVEVGDLLRLSSAVLHTERIAAPGDAGAGTAEVAAAMTSSSGTSTSTGAGSAAMSLQQPQQQHQSSSPGLSALAAAGAAVVQGAADAGTSAAAVVPDDGEAAAGRLVVEVQVRVTKPESVSSYVTTTVHFVFGVCGGAGRRLRHVLPTSEEEGLRAWRALQEL